MGSFDFSSIGVKPKSQDYGFLVDQLEIKRNQLESDGKLSPGDLKVLQSMAQSVYAHPGLTPAQRSNIEVKISQFEQLASTTKLNDTRDIGRLDREVKDDDATGVMLYGNNPELFLKRKSDVLRLKLDRLTQSIESLENAGDDSSSHVNEFNNTLNEFNDISQAMDDMRTAQANPGGKPTSNFVAYVTTNSQGEISNVEIGRTGSKSGFAETNGLYGGLQIYAKPNRKEGGKNVFILGNNRFSGSDLQIQDPLNPGAFRNAPLLSDDTKQGRNFGLAVETYKPIDFTQVRPQGAIRPGGWAEGEKGFLYKRNENGKYTKYVNAKRDQLGITDNDVIRIPRGLEQNIIPNIDETIDGSAMAPMPMPAIGSAPIPTATAPTTTAPTAAPAPAGRSRTPAPTERAPQSITGIAGRALSAGKNFLQYVFSRE